jgi:hypothetical protein
MQQIERRFLFKGNASVVGGRIVRPRDLIIEAGGACSLTVAGGRSKGSLKRTKFGRFASVGSASTLAEAYFDDLKRARALSNGLLAEDSLTTTTIVRSDVRNVAVGRRPLLKVAQLRGALTAQSPRTSGEASIKTGELRIAGVTVDGHALVVTIDDELFEKYDTRAKLLTAVDKPAFRRARATCLVLPTGGGPARATTGSFLMQADGTIYASVVREIRWKGKPYPGSSIDGHVVTIPNFGKIFFGEIFVAANARRLTMMRLQLGSPVGGFMAFSEAESNGSWYP